MNTSTAHDDELVSNAVEIKMRAQSRAGAMLIEGKETGQIATKGQPEKKCDKPATLSEVGITRHESAKYQQLARVPEHKFEKAITIVKERDGVLTEAAVKRLRRAQLRELYNVDEIVREEQHKVQQDAGRQIGRPGRRSPQNRSPVSRVGPCRW